jgi:hypothetical protein
VNISKNGHRNIRSTELTTGNKEAATYNEVNREENKQMQRRGRKA